jgi:cobalamin-dependent methionine synthase I
MLQPKDIGVEGCRMDPVASVPAVVFHHPGATYFSVT